MKISIQGYKGSFHDVVASKLWPEKTLLERSSFNEVFADVKDGRADFGVVAIENSIAGAILENYDRLRNSGLTVVAEDYLRIVHNLMALPGQKIEDIREVWSHPMALKQCQEFLSKYPHIKQVEADDTAGVAGRIVREGLTGIAAIASSLAAEIYGAEILAAEIETDPQNYTRFLVITKDFSVTKGAISRHDVPSYKTSLYIETAHKPGGLLNALQVLSVAGFNMTMLVSRPVIGKAWEYGFYIDFTHAEEDWSSIKSDLALHADFITELGTYPEHRQNGKS